MATSSMIADVRSDVHIIKRSNAVCQVGNAKAAYTTVQVAGIGRGFKRSPKRVSANAKVFQSIYLQSTCFCIYTSIKGNDWQYAYPLVCCCDRPAACVINPADNKNTEPGNIFF